MYDYLKILPSSHNALCTISQIFLWTVFVIINAFCWDPTLGVGQSYRPKISLSDHQTFLIFWCHAWMAFEGRFSSVSCDTRCMLNTLPGVQFSSFVKQFFLESSRKDHHYSSLSATFHGSFNKKSCRCHWRLQICRCYVFRQDQWARWCKKCEAFLPWDICFTLMLLGTRRDVERHGETWRDMVKRRPSLTFSCLCVCVETIGTLCSFHRRVLDEWPGIST